MDWLDDIAPDYDVVIEKFDKSQFMNLTFGKEPSNEIHDELLKLNNKTGFKVYLLQDNITYKIEYPITYNLDTIYNALIKLFDSHNLTTNTITY